MKTIFTFLTCFLIRVISFSQSGTLDKSFGDTGVVITPVNGGLSSLALQSNGRIIAGGTLVKDEIASIGGSALIGYLPSGKLDYSFGDKGLTSLNDQANITAIVVLKDDKIIAASYSAANTVLTKYLSNGTLDSAFGVNGQVQQNIKGYYGIVPRAVQVQPDGKIVTTGEATYFDADHELEPKIITERFNINGSLDESFGGKGYVITNGKTGNAVAIQQDGKIVIGGNTGFERFITLRYLPDGSPDESFGYHGVVETAFSGYQSYINTLALQPDGKIVAAGKEGVNLGDVQFGDMGIVRYLPDGSLDKSFGDNGISIVKFESGSEATNVLLQNDGKITLAGKVYNFFDTAYFAVARLNTNGLLDSSFGTNGLTTTTITGKDFETSGILQRDGKILVGGINNDATDFILARYNNDNTTQNKPIALIKKWIEHHILHWQNMQPSAGINAYSIQQSSNGINGFSEIAKVFSSNKNVYTYSLPATTGSASATTNYYRINALNVNGNIVASTSVISDVVAASTAISIYPNPVKDVVNIKGLDAGTKYEVRITNEKGSEMAKASVGNVNTYTWNVQPLASGVYYVRVTSTNNKTVTLKFVKE